MWSTLRSLTGSSSSSIKEQQQQQQQQQDHEKEVLHRKRVAQILRYISTMQQSSTTATSAGALFIKSSSASASGLSLEQHQNHQDPRHFGPFFQDNKNTAAAAASSSSTANNSTVDDDLLVAATGARVLFTLYDFQRLAALMANTSGGESSSSQQQQQQQQLPFSFYTTAASSSGNNSNNNSSNYKRNILGRRVMVGSMSNSSSSECCWLRLTRLTGADVPSPPTLSSPVIIASYLQSWLADDQFAQLATATTTLLSSSSNANANAASLSFLERKLIWGKGGGRASSAGHRQHRQHSLDQLILPSTAPAKVQRWWRRYVYYRKMVQLQRRLEPLYNHLFEWYHQTQENAAVSAGGGGGGDTNDTLELIWGLGQARLWDTKNNMIVDGPLLQVHVEVELARDGALLVRPKEHAGVSLNQHVMAAIAAASSSLGGGGNTKNGGGGGGDADETIWEAASNNNKTITVGESTTTRQLRQLVEGLNASDLSPGQPSTYIPLLKRMAVELSSGGTFQTCSTTNSKRMEALLRQGHLVVTDAWCVYSSPRPSAVWARDAYVFAEKLSLTNKNSSNNNGRNDDAAVSSTSSSGMPVIPRALKALTLGPGALDETKEIKNSSKSNNNNDSPGNWLQKVMSNPSQKDVADNKDDDPTPSSRPPFPLPTSDAQNRIAELLLTRNYPAVVCEGPPGTGKTHTIANIVCAYLCQGKRVLVTSKGAPALSVLRERLPECVQELCVDVSKSESSGMRQLQQTVERLANKVAWVNTERELGKSNALQANIEELEEELRTIDRRLGSNAEEKRGLVQTQRGQDLFESALELIESTPWLMKTISTWDVKQVQELHATMESLVISAEAPMAMVDGFESPPSDALISLAASKAGLALSYLKNATKEVFSKVPLLGSRMAEHCSTVQEQLDLIRVNGVTPSTSHKKDWYLIFERLKREKEVHTYCQDTLEPLFSREGWPREILIEVIDGKKRIRESIIPVLAKALKMKQIAADLDLSSTLEEAIEIEKLDKRRAGLSSRIQAVAEDLVAARVVAELSKNFSAEAQSALVKFAQVSGKAKFGKSSQSSKMTQRQRRKRQEYLDAFEKCVRYIPCWILTSSQISDYLPSECLFDLVVIDEASQSDVTVLPGMLRGRQWLIVGDGKQVSPTESFVAEEQIEMLKAAMPESPFEASMLPGHSFFDLCAQAFPMGRVILREHFRCAPEIISYSNLEFYNGNLVPLRLPTSKERLKPSLIDVRVPNGRKVGKINEQECDEIVNQIGQYVDRCSLFQKRSIGVISLVGDEQSRLIRGRLLDRIGPHKYKLHNILVGEPPSFQGAERDIVFLSMVCSPGSVVTQSQLMHAQRVNVALSRARDRMVLIRSLDTNHIPNEQDVKFSVLDFFERAKYNDEAANAGHLDDIQEEREASGGDDTPTTSSPFRARAERLLVKLLEEDGFSTRSMGIVWDNAICVEDAAAVAGTDDSTGRRAAICIEATGESQEDWKAMLDQQKSIERVGWKCLRVDAVSFLANNTEVLAAIKKFLASVLVFPRAKLAHENAAGVGVQEVNAMEEDDDSNHYQAGADENHAIELDLGGQAAAQQQDQEDELVVISSDEEEEDEEEQMYDGDMKPAAVPRPSGGSLRIKQEEPQEQAFLDGLGNGETAADYGNVADLGFLGGGAASSSKYDSEEEDDEEEEDDDDDIVAFSAPATTTRVAKRPAAAARSRKKQRIQRNILEVDDHDEDGDDDDDDDDNPVYISAAARPPRVDATKTGRKPAKSKSKSFDLQDKERAVRQSSKRTFPNDDLSVDSSSSSGGSSSISGSPEVDVGSAAPSRSSSNNKRRRKTRLDKYSKDPRWSHRQEGEGEGGGAAHQEDDISHEEYISEVQPEPWSAAAREEQQQHQHQHQQGGASTMMDLDDDNDNDQDDQDLYEEELQDQQRYPPSDDESYRDEDEGHDV